MNRRRLEARLSDLSSFRDPDPDHEQYPTTARLAAHLIHLADLQGDLERPVVDLGAGTGMLAVGAALKGARVLGAEIDPGPLAVARENAASAGVEVAWIRADATASPLCWSDIRSDSDRWSAPDGPTVLSNPPFGAQTASVGDRPFLALAARLASVSYTIHNADSRSFVESFAEDNGGAVTHAFRGRMDLDRQFEFHDDDRQEIDVEVFRIDWR